MMSTPRDIVVRVWRLNQWDIDCKISGKKFKFQQWTGLNDKNGKKIFEGDIVTLWLGAYPYPSGRFEITFNRGSFCLKMIESGGVTGIVFPLSKKLVIKDGEPTWEEQQGGEQSLYNFNGSIMEVIGNKLENPNLLKET